MADAALLPSENSAFPPLKQQIWPLQAEFYMSSAHLDGLFRAEIGFAGQVAKGEPSGARTRAVTLTSL